MPRATFRVGDRVRIRQWNDMARQFPVEDGTIQTTVGFVPNMRRFCGMQGVIQTILSGGCVEFAPGSPLYDAPWAFDTDMIELVNDKEIRVGDLVQVRSWKEMERKWGSDIYGINTPHLSFLRNMKRACGLIGRVESIIQDADGEVYKISGNPILDRVLQAPFPVSSPYRLTKYMIKKAKEF